MAELREVSMTAREVPQGDTGKTAVPAERPVLLLTVNERETDALRAVFGTNQPSEHFEQGDYPYLRFGPVLDKQGKPLRDVIAFRCQMGAERSGAAPQRVAKAIAHFDPAAVLAVGVGFGLKDSQRLGDVLIASQVTTYESARLNEDGSIVRRAETPPATPAWLERATQIALDGIQRRSGLVLCGEKLVDNAEFRERLRKDFPLAIGGDMESFGVATACMGHDGLRVGWLMIKGVSDLGDGNKNAVGGLQADLNQYQAAYRAAIVAYSAIYLCVPDVPPPEAAARAWLQTHASEPAGELPSNWVQLSSVELPSPAGAIPLQLPPAAHKFFGRTDALQTLADRLREGLTTTVIADAGMGKTALAAEALRRLLGTANSAQARAALADTGFPDGIVFLDLYRHHGQANQSWTDVANALCGSEFLQTNVASVRAVQACAGKRFLLIVEGGEEARGGTEADGFVRTTRRALLEPLVLQGPVLWLTRRSGESLPLEELRLDQPLGNADARALFDHLSAGRVAAEWRDRALALLGGHPLAITWAAALLGRGDEPPQYLLDDLQQQPGRNLRDPEEARHTLHWLFERSLRGLDDYAHRSLHAAGLLAPEPFPLAAIAAGTGLNERAQREALVACVRTSLLRLEPGGGAGAVPHWRFAHALGYGFARNAIEAEPETRATLLPGLAQWAHADLCICQSTEAAPQATAQAQRSLQHAIALLRADAAPGLWLPLVNAFLYDVGDRFVALGQLTSALSALQAVEPWLASLSAIEANAIQWQREVAACHSRLGNLLQAQGDLPGALRRFEASLKVAERLAAQAPESPARQHDLSICHNKIGDLLQAQDDLIGAQKCFEASLHIRERLTAQDPANADRQRDLSVSHSKFGVLLQAQGDLPGAQRQIEACLYANERLVAQDPANVQWQHDLSVTHHKLGDLLQAQDDLPGAQRQFEDSLRIVEGLVTQDPANTKWQRDLSISHERLGDLLQARDDLPGAQHRFDLSLCIRERLATHDPANAQWQRDLGVSHIKFAMLTAAQSDLSGALSRLQEARAVFSALVQRAPGHPQFQRDLARVEEMIAIFENPTPAL